MPDLDLATQPNDAFFKEVFSDPGRAAAFFRSHLPPEITTQVDWPLLALVPGSFVQTDLQQTHSDLLFSVPAGGRNLNLYLLFEHQSTVDPLLRLRLLGYMLEIMRSQVEIHGLPAPPVLAFVLHQGPDTWTVSEEFGDLFDLKGSLAEALGPYLPKFRHALLDLTRFDPAKEEDDRQIRVVLQLMKLARTKELLQFFGWLAEWKQVVSELPGDLLRLLLLYALHADSKLDVKQVSHKLQDNPQLQNSAMSIASKLIAEGREEGIEKGLWMGNVQMIQRFMEQTPTARAELETWPLDQLKARFAELEQEYAKRFKQA